MTEYAPAQTACVSIKNIWRIMKMIASRDIICSLLKTNNVCGQISEDLSEPNGGYCLFNSVACSIYMRGCFFGHFCLYFSFLYFGGVFKKTILFHLCLLDTRWLQLRQSYEPCWLSFISCRHSVHAYRVIFFLFFFVF